MPHANPSGSELRELLTRAHNIAVIGASSKPGKASHGIMRKLLSAGYSVIPINPNEREVLGQKAYPTLAAAPGPVDIVNVFRRPESTQGLAAEAAQAGAKALWLQTGIVNEETAARGRALGLMVVMDLCIGVEHAVLRIPKKSPA
jgi:predicted CoA-binding protein